MKFPTQLLAVILLSQLVYGCEWAEAPKPERRVPTPPAPASPPYSFPGEAKLKPAILKMSADEVAAWAFPERLQTTERVEPLRTLPGGYLSGLILQERAAPTSIDRVCRRVTHLLRLRNVSPELLSEEESDWLLEPSRHTLDVWYFASAERGPGSCGRPFQIIWTRTAEAAVPAAEYVRDARDGLRGREGAAYPVSCFKFKIFSADCRAHQERLREALESPEIRASECSSKEAGGKCFAFNTVLHGFVWTVRLRGSDTLSDVRLEKIGPDPAASV